MKKLLIAGLMAATTMLVATPAAAQVQFQGTAYGCFTAGCTPTGSDTMDGLTYTQGSFNQSTDSTGFLALGGSPDGLGFFSQDGSATSYSGDVFRLLVTFTLPAGSTPGSTLFQTLLQGTVTGVNGGGVFVNFDNTPLLFNSSAGEFTFTIADLNVTGGSAFAAVTANIQAAVPEPGTWAMMLLGFGAIGYSMRRRRKPLLQLA